MDSGGLQASSNDLRLTETEQWQKDRRTKRQKYKKDNKKDSDGSRQIMKEVDI